HIQLFIDENNLSKEYQLALNNRLALSVINIFITISSPKNPANIRSKVDAIKRTLTHPLYDSTLELLSLQYFPLHWKIFFTLCKWQMSLGVYLLALLMRRLRKRY